MVNAGRLRERATVQRLTSGAIDAYGNVYSGWENLLSRQVDVRERLGKEAIEGGALADVVTATVRLRKDSETAAITHADRVSLRGYTWAIKSIVQVDAKGTLLEMLLERGVAT